MIELSGRQKKLLSWLGYPALALITFVLTAFYTFPYDSLKAKVEQAASSKFDLTIGSAGPTIIPGGVVFRDVVLRTRPEDPDEKPAVIRIDELSADPSMLSLLTGTMAVDFEAEVGGGGVIEGSFAMDDGMDLAVTTDSLPLGKLPWIATAVGLPIEGKLDAEIELSVPKMKWSDTDGRVALSCPGCTIGDGKSEINLTPQRGRYRGKDIYESGIPVPPLSLGNLKVLLTVEDGVAETERFGGESDDGRLYIDVKIRLGDPFAKSRLSGCLEYKISESLEKKGKVAKEFYTATMVMQSQTRRPDGSHAMTLGGTVSRFRPGKRPCSAAPGSTSTPAQERKRPSISTLPPQPPEEPVDTTGEIRVTPPHSGMPTPEEMTRALEKKRAAEESAAEEEDESSESAEPESAEAKEAVEDSDDGDEGDDDQAKARDQADSDEDTEASDQEEDESDYAEESTGEGSEEEAPEGSDEDEATAPRIRALPSPE